jgi:RNA polymerase sigma factor for flagellar operon FliA
MGEKKVAKMSLIKRLKTENNGKLTLEQKNVIIAEYAPLIKFIAQRISMRLPANIELDDLISCGVIGLMDAIDKYDETRDNKFKTYAEFRIRGAILDELRAQDWVPRSVRDKAKLLTRAGAKLEAELGRIPEDHELADYMKISMDEYYSLVNQAKPVSVLSIDEQATYSAGDKKSLMSLVDGVKSQNPFMHVNDKRIKKKISKCIEALPERQRLVLSLYYYEELNLKDIGEVLKVTESRVSQLHAQAVTRLKDRLTQVFDEPERIAS